MHSHRSVHYRWPSHFCSNKYTSSPMCRRKSRWKSIAWSATGACQHWTIESSEQTSSQIFINLFTNGKHSSLSYTEACVREIMRFETLVTPGLMHKAMVDTKFLNYDIPKVMKYLFYQYRDSWSFLVMHISGMSRDAWTGCRCPRQHVGQSVHIQTRTLLRCPRQIGFDQRSFNAFRCR